MPPARKRRRSTRARGPAPPAGPVRLPSPRLWTDPVVFERLREGLFARSWQIVAHESELPAAADRCSALPVTLLPGLLDEPLLIVREGRAAPRALSNACTHRGALVCEQPRTLAAGETLRCRYHGRRFGPDGRCLGAPGFDALPAEAGLPRADLARWRGFLFARAVADARPASAAAARLPSRAREGEGLPSMPGFAELVADVDALLGWLPFERAELDASRSRDYEVAAHWALYCDNYLEGFHVPFVHAGLAPALDLPRYRCETHRWSSVQVGIAPPGAPALEPPPGAPGHGDRVAGYFAWLFPTTMLNVYPWGVSLNLVQPLGVERTRIAFRSWVWDRELLDRGAGSDLHRVELEDEEVVRSVQRGVRGRLWRRGGYAPGQEDCVRHFHALLAPWVTDAG